MKKCLVFLLAATLLLLCIGSASATLMWTGTYNPANKLISHTDFIDKQLVRLEDFDPTTDKIGSAYADLYLYDDEEVNGDDGWDKAMVNFTTDHVDETIFEVDGNRPRRAKKYTVQLIQGLWGLDDGSTPFTLKAEDGHDFFFKKIVYRAYSVPEPATVGLIIFGLLGLATIRRKKIKV